MLGRKTESTAGVTFGPHRSRRGGRGCGAASAAWPKGEVRGALLEDGRMIRVPAHAVESIAELLTSGARLAVGGEGLLTEFGTVIEAGEVGTSDDSLGPFKPKK